MLQTRPARENFARGLVTAALRWHIVAAGAPPSPGFMLKRSLVFGWVLVTAARAQFSTLPPTLSPSFDPFGSQAEWSARFHNLTTSGAQLAPIETLAAGDGIAMGGSAPAAGSDIVGLRVIYLGNSAATPLDLGVTFGAPGAGAAAASSDPTAVPAAAAFTLFNGAGSPPAALTFWDIPLTPALFAGFDLWLNVAPDAARPGGLFHAFHPEWDTGPAAGAGNAYWSQGFGLSTYLFDPATTSVRAMELTTHLLAFEDAQEGATDDDRSDLILAVQVIRKDGHPTVAGVPEPAVTGALGAAALAGLAIFSRRRG